MYKRDQLMGPSSNDTVKKNFHGVNLDNFFVGLNNINFTNIHKFLVPTIRHLLIEIGIT